MSANITMRQLEIFVAITNFKHLTKAAESLHLSQAAASLSLSELESQLETKLFDRIGGRMHLNSQGQRLYERAIDILDRFRDLPSVLQEGAALSGKINIGSSCTIGNYILPQIIAGFVHDFPHSQLELSITSTENAVKQLLNNDVDIAFVEGNYEHQQILKQHWMEECLIFIASPASELVSQQLTTETLKGQNWILRNRGSNTREVFDKAMECCRGDLAVRLELDHTQAVINAVAAGLGISCVSRIAAQPDLLSGKLVKLGFRLPAMKRSLYVLVHRNKYVSALLQQFIDYSKRSAFNFTCAEHGLHPQCDCKDDHQASIIS